mmetsp:Transcript_43332/g.92768  ORF Transcript_43332/g.92768 Transcript_43332/m.92768 type:complete len:493 (+) Transcript_43332:344-1822(+)
MPVARRATPPTSQIKEHKSVLTSLSAWTDTGETEGRKTAGSKNGYKTLNGAPALEEERGVLAQWLDTDSDKFNMAIGMVIIANALVIGGETEFGSTHFSVFEHVFNTIFLTEMVLRIRSMGRGYFQEPWNIFDFVLVVTGTLDLWVLPFFTMGSANRVLYHFSVMRMLRILRLLRVLRVVRLFRMFQHLYLIMQAFSKAFQIVLLMGLLVFILNYVCAIMLTQGIGQSTDSWEDPEEKEQIEAWFGSIPNSMQTLFMVMTLSGWDEIAQTLMKVMPASVIFTGLVLYIMITSYTMTSLVTGIISESLITSQQEYRLRKEKVFEDKKKELSNDLRETLYSLHEDEKDSFNNVKLEDLKTTMRGDTETLMKLAGINIIIDEAGVLNLIDKLASDSGDINIDYFVDKLSNLTGGASASSVMDLKYDVSKLSNAIDGITKTLGIDKKVEDAADEPVTPSSSQYATPTKRSSLRQAAPIGFLPSEKKEKPRFADVED